MCLAAGLAVCESVYRLQWLLLRVPVMAQGVMLWACPWLAGSWQLGHAVISADMHVSNIVCSGGTLHRSTQQASGSLKHVLLLCWHYSTPFRSCHLVLQLIVVYLAAGQHRRRQLAPQVVPPRPPPAAGSVHVQWLCRAQGR